MGILDVFAGPYALVAKWGVIAALSVSLLGFGWVKGNAHGTQKLYDYQVEVRVAGDAQNLKTRQRILDDKQLKQDTDNVYKANLGRLTTRIAGLTKRLQNASDASGSVLPAVPSGSASPNRACFDRTLLDGALRAFTAGAAGLVGEGEGLKLKLDTGIAWVAVQTKVK